MEQLARLKARIASLNELRDLIRAMRALAATHVQEAQAALAGMRRYVVDIEDAIAAAATLLPGLDAGGWEGPAEERSALVVVCSEHGFTGAFDERLLDRAVAVRKPGQALAVLGRRGALVAEARGLSVAWSFAMATRVAGVLAITRRLADRLADVTEADVVFGRYRRGGAYDVVVRNVLPLDPALLTAAPSRPPPLHQLPADVLLQRIAAEYLFGELTAAVLETLASENGARLRVMEAADRNIADKLETLQRHEHVARQEAITAELLDVVTGAEAIRRRDVP